jgi:hypothetical protein
MLEPNTIRSASISPQPTTEYSTRHYDQRQNDLGDNDTAVYCEGFNKRSSYTHDETVVKR